MYGKKISENDNERILISLSSQLYDKKAVFNASYRFTNICYFEINLNGTEINVIIQKKNKDIELDKIKKEFLNILIDEQIRLDVGAEFKNIREELVKRAFSSISKRER